MEKVLHNISPVYDDNSKILILGSFPSVKSRETSFFYGHPQNRFWKVISSVFNENIPYTVDEKKALLLRSGVALWDVIESCEINGSSDSSIKNAKANDLSPIIKSADIKAIFTNGKTADRLYKKHLEELTGLNSVCLPSTSPANAAWSLDKLVEIWKKEITKHY